MQSSWLILFVLASTLSVAIAAPSFIATYPSVLGSTVSGWTTDVQLNMPGIAYWVVVPDNDPSGAPTAQQIKDGQNALGSLRPATHRGSIAVPFVTTTASTTITGMNGFSNYDMYVVAEDLNGNLMADGAVAKLDASTLSANWAATYPQVGNIQPDGFDIIAEADASGSVPFVVVARGDVTTTTPTEIVDAETGVNGVFLRGQVNLYSANTPITYTVTGLTPSTQYDVYMVLANGEQTSVDVASQFFQVDTAFDTILSDIEIDGPHWYGVNISITSSQGADIRFVLLPPGTHSAGLDSATFDTEYTGANTEDKGTFTVTGGVPIVYTHRDSLFTSATQYELFLAAVSGGSYSVVEGPFDIASLFDAGAGENEWNAGFEPTISSITTLGGTFEAELEQAGTILFIIVPILSTRPDSPEELREWVNTGVGFNNVVATGRITQAGVADAVAESLLINTLDAQTPYDVWAVGADASEVFFTPRFHHRFVTSAATESNFAFSNTNVEGFDWTIQYDGRGTVLWAVQPGSTTPPTCGAIATAVQTNTISGDIIEMGRSYVTTVGVDIDPVIVTDLDAGTLYQVFVCASDASENIYSSVYSSGLERTSSAQALVGSGDIYQTSPTATTVDVVARLDGKAVLAYAITLVADSGTLTDCSDLRTEVNTPGTFALVKSRNKITIAAANEFYQETASINLAACNTLYTLLYCTINNIDEAGSVWPSAGAPQSLGISTVYCGDFDSAPTINQPSTTSVSFRVDFDMDTDSNVYVIALSDGVSAPATAADFMSIYSGGVGGTTMGIGTLPNTGTAPTFITISGLASSTAFDVYVMANDVTDAYSSAIQTKLDVSTLSDNDFQATYPQVNSITAAGGTIEVQTLLTGRVLYAITLQGAGSVPTSGADIKTAVNAGVGGDYLAVGSFAVTTTTSIIGELIDTLDASSDYFAYVVASDDTESFYSALPGAVSFSTLNSVYTMQGANPSSTGFDLVFNCDAKGGLVFVVKVFGTTATVATTDIRDVSVGTNNVLFKGTLDIAAANIDFSSAVTGLSPGTQYSIFATHGSDDLSSLGTIVSITYQTSININIDSVPLTSSVTTNDATLDPVSVNTVAGGAEVRFMAVAAGTSIADGTAFDTLFLAGAGINNVAKTGTLTVTDASVDYSYSLSAGAGGNFLAAGLWYDVYLLPGDTGSNFYGSLYGPIAVQMLASFSLVSNVAVWNAPSVDLTCDPDAAGNHIYWAVLEAGTTPPVLGSDLKAIYDAGEVGTTVRTGLFDTNDILSATSDTVTIDGLFGGTDYDLYSVLADQASSTLFSTVYPISSTTVNPSFVTGKATNPTSTGFDLYFEVDSFCTILFVVMTDGQPAPSAATLASQVDNPTGFFKVGGRQTVVDISTGTTITVSGLSVGTAYEIFAILTNEAEDVSSYSSVYTVTDSLGVDGYTTQIQINWVQYPVPVTQAGGTTFDFTYEVDAAAHIYYIVVETVVANQPTTQEEFADWYINCAAYSADECGSVTASANTPATITLPDNSAPPAAITDFTEQKSFNIYWIPADMAGPPPSQMAELYGPIPWSSEISTATQSVLSSDISHYYCEDSVGSIDFDITIGATAGYHVIVVITTSGNGPASAQELKALHTAGVGGDVVAISTTALNIAGANSEKLTGFACDTSYELFFAIEDDALNSYYSAMGTIPFTSIGDFSTFSIRECDTSGCFVSVTGNNMAGGAGAYGDGVSTVNVGGINAIAPSAVPPTAATTVTFTTGIYTAPSTGLGDVIFTTGGASKGTISRTSYFNINAGTVSSITPRDDGPQQGGNYVTITGTNLGSGADITSVKLAGLSATLVSQSATSVIVIADELSPTQTNAVVGDIEIDSTSQGFTTILNGYTYNPLPLISSISPSIGVKSGGDTITISGTDLGNGADVIFVSLNQVEATVVSQTESEVVVTTGDGTDYTGTEHVKVVSISAGTATALNAWTYNTGCCWRHPHLYCTGIPDDIPECQSVTSLIV